MGDDNRSALPAQRSTALYRMFDTDGQLLYVGISGRLPTRLAAHQSDKAWWADVASITVEHFNDRSEAADAEKKAIIAEHPEHNVTHSVDIGRRRLPEAEASKRSPAVISGMRGYIAAYGGSYDQAVVGWDADGDALICATDGALVKARDVEGFMFVFDNYSATFVSSEGWSVERNDEGVKPIAAWGVSAAGHVAPMVVANDGELRPTVQVNGVGWRIVPPIRPPAREG